MSRKVLLGHRWTNRGALASRRSKDATHINAMLKPQQCALSLTIAAVMAHSECTVIAHQEQRDSWGVKTQMMGANSAAGRSLPE